MDVLVAAIADLLGRTARHVKMIRLVQMPVWVPGLVLLLVIALVVVWIVVDRRRHYGRRD